jgi:hypothetical protein
MALWSRRPGSPLSTRHRARRLLPLPTALRSPRRQGQSDGAAREEGAGVRTPSGGRAYREGLSGLSWTAFAPRWLTGRLRSAQSDRESMTIGFDTPAFRPRQRGARSTVWTPRSLRPWRPSSSLFGGAGEGVEPRAPPGLGSLLSGTNGTTWWSAATLRAKAGRLNYPSGWLGSTGRSTKRSLPFGVGAASGVPSVGCRRCARAYRVRNRRPRGCDRTRLREHRRSPVYGGNGAKGRRGSAESKTETNSGGGARVILRSRAKAHERRPRWIPMVRRGRVVRKNPEAVQRQEGNGEPMSRYRTTPDTL